MRSTGAAEVLTSGEDITQSKIVSRALSLLKDLQESHVVALDLKDLFGSLSTQRVIINKSIRTDVSVIRYEFEINAVHSFVWVPGKKNLSNPGPKSISLLEDPLQLLFATGKLPLETCRTFSRRSDRSLCRPRKG